MRLLTSPPSPTCNSASTCSLRCPAFRACHAYGQRSTIAQGACVSPQMRFARLWPLHIAVLALFVLLELAKFVFSHADGLMALDLQPFSDGIYTLWQIVTNAPVPAVVGSAFRTDPERRGSERSGRILHFDPVRCRHPAVPRRRYDVFLACAWPAERCSTRFRRTRCSFHRLGQCCGRSSALPGA